VPAVVSDALARELWPRGDALGARLTVRKQAAGRADYGRPVPAVVVGVAADVPVGSVDETAPVPAVYLPFTANPWRWATLVVRGERGTAAETAALVPLVRRAVRAVDADLPVADVRTGAAILADNLAERRLQLWLLATFAAAALVLSALGVYGVIAHGVALRAPELGVRAALGADRGRLLRLVVGEGARIAGAGLAVGGAGAVAAARVLEGLVYGVGVRDLPTYLGVAATLGLVALAACWLPARRAARTDPAAALRGS
jgi:putative ABC transport system permease protein